MVTNPQASLQSRNVMFWEQHTQPHSDQPYQMTTWLMLCRFGLLVETSEGVLWMPRRKQQFLGSPRIQLVYPQILNWTETLGSWRASQHLDPVFVFLKLFLNHFCRITVHIIMEI